MRGKMTRGFLSIFIVLGAFESVSNGREAVMEKNNLELATFAGGCFWCMVPPFKELPGVEEVVSGYIGGTKPNPTYEEVSSGSTGYLEAIQIKFDPKKTTYQELLDAFWYEIDPTDAGGQFVDRGHQYKSAVFFHSAAQEKAAMASKEALAKSGVFDRPIMTLIRSAGTFYPAEDYHQDYYKKNPARYKYYRNGSGRDQFLEKTWSEQLKKKTEAPAANPLAREDLKKKLTLLQFNVTQDCGTEPPFHNEYWDNHRAGIYVDVVSGEPLFASTDKFDSGTGWPSFTKPLEPGNVVEKEDKSFIMKRTEVRSKGGNSHLGHVFNDGPRPAGVRYCINSAALRFIPTEDLENEGYGKYRSFFNKSR